MCHLWVGSHVLGFMLCDMWQWDCDTSSHVHGLTRQASLDRSAVQQWHCGQAIGVSGLYIGIVCLIWLGTHCMEHMFRDMRQWLADATGVVHGLRRQAGFSRSIVQRWQCDTAIRHSTMHNEQLCDLWLGPQCMGHMLGDMRQWLANSAGAAHGLFTTVMSLTANSAGVACGLLIMVMLCMANSTGIDSRNIINSWLNRCCAWAQTASEPRQKSRAAAQRTHLDHPQHSFAQ